MCRPVGFAAIMITAHSIEQQRSFNYRESVTKGKKQQQMPWSEVPRFSPRHTSNPQILRQT